MEKSSKEGQANRRQMHGQLEGASDRQTKRLTDKKTERHFENIVGA